jgi:hypothetical protein
MKTIEIINHIFIFLFVLYLFCFRGGEAMTVEQQHEFYSAYKLLDIPSFSHIARTAYHSCDNYRNQVAQEKSQRGQIDEDDTDNGIAYIRAKPEDMKLVTDEINKLRFVTEDTADGRSNKNFK